MSNLLGVFQTFGENFVRRLQMPSIIIALVFAVIGVFTGSVGSLISMRKYLKEQGGVINEE